MGTLLPRSLGDFTPIHDLVQSISTQDFAYDGHDGDSRKALECMKTERPGSTDVNDKSTILGDFSKLWEFLGTSPSPIKATASLPLDAYASDGAIFSKSLKTTKKVKWYDGTTSDGQSAGFVSDGFVSAPAGGGKLTKTQRKRKNRQEKKARVAESSSKSAVTSESEGEVITDIAKLAKKSGTHYLYGKDKPITRYTQPGNAGGSFSLPKPQADASAPTPAERAGAHVPAVLNAKSKAVIPGADFNATISAARESVQKQLATMSTRPEPARRHTENMTPLRKDNLLIPSSVTPNKKAARTSFSTVGQSPAMNGFTPSSNKPIIQPLHLRSVLDRYYGLIRKLDHDFPEDQKYLAAPTVSTMKFDPGGIHVFVDDSNIFIGFIDKLKENRGIPQRTFVTEPVMSFDAFALLLERRRPVAKRVLGGSKPELPAHGKARRLGYDCYLLEKVYKERELTERQIFFMERDRGLRSESERPPDANTVFTSGNVDPFAINDTPKQYARAKLVEQCVDELLHLKMAESMLDIAQPTTMVVATGDAASAEYSDGFMAHIQRALTRGWKVELVSWRNNVSSMYKRKDWTQKWAGKFRIIYLDDYVEDLLDM